MDQRSAYLLQVLEKIGAPLMTAITDVRGLEDDSGQDAQTIAALLGKTVQAGIDLGQITQTNPAEAMDDSLRVALTALAGPLVAGQYKKRGTLPDDAGMKRIISSLQAVLTFSENFSPSAENAQRLQDITARGQEVDAAQTQIQYVQAFMPVVEAVAAFPFGQPEQKLLMEVSERLSKTAVEMRETLLPHLQEENEQKRAELALLQSLAGLYSAVHAAETKKVLDMGDAARDAGLSMAPVWKQFDLRISMLEALSRAIVPGGAAVPAPQHPAQPAQPAPAVAAPPEQAPPQPAPSQEQPAQTAPPIFQPQTPPPAQAPPAESAPPAQASAPPASGNPMAMFAKPKSDAPPAQPVAQPPAEQAPAQQAVQTPPPIFQAPPQNPPPAQSEDSSGDQGEGGEGGQSSGGGPMSFFKKSD